MKLLLAPTFAALLLAVPFAHAKLPPPLPEAAAKAEEAKAKAAWDAKISAFKLCQAQDRVAQAYRQTAGTASKPAIETPACADPGPLVVEAKPLEAAGAHSPAPTTATPPNINPATQTQLQGRSK